MITLDMRTVLNAGALFCAVCFIVMLLMWMQAHTRFKALSFWVTTLALIATGQILIGFRDHITAWISVPLANSLVVGGYAFLFLGFQRFLGMKLLSVKNIFALVGLAVFVFLHSYYTFVRPDLAARITNVSSFILLFSLLGFVLLASNKRPETRAYTTGVSVALVFSMLPMLGRIVGINLVQTTNFMASGLYDTSMVLLWNGSIVALTFSLILMLNRMSLTEISLGEQREIRLNEILRSVRNINQLITQEKDRHILIDKSCRILTEIHGFTKCWIAIFDVSGKVAGTAEVNWGNAFLPFIEQLKKGLFPRCIVESLKQTRPTLITSNHALCGDCVLFQDKNIYRSIILPMNYSGDKKGVIALTSLSHIGPSGEELDLLHELAGDLAFALHNCDLEDQRKHDEIFLHNTLAHQDAILSAVPDIIMEVDNNKVYTWANQAGKYFFGDDVIGREAAFYFEGEQPTYQAVQPVFNGSPETIYVESWQRRKDGEKRLLAYWCHSLKDSGGRVIGALSAAQDITERRQRELEVINARLLLQASIESPKGMIIMAIDRDYRYLCFNSTHKTAMKYAYGKDVETGMNVLECITSEVDKQNAKENYDRAMAGISHSTIQVYGDINKSYYESFYNPILDSHHQVIGITAFSMDITERKNAEAALKKSAQRLKEAQALGKIGSWEFDPLTGNIEWSEEVYVLYERDKALGPPTAEEEAAYYTPEDVKRTREFSRQAIEEGKEFNYEIEAIMPGGKTKYFQATMRPVKDSEGHLLKLFGTVQDITDRKQTEAENLRLREKAEVSSRLAAVGEMAAGIAHEINNPLTGVIGFAQLLDERQDLPEDAREQLKVIADGGNRVKDIVKRMLTFARQHKPVKNSLDIHQLIDNTLEIRSYVLRTANIEVIKYYDPHLPCVVVDPGQMQQVFLNLIVNAEYSMKKAHGKGKLVITTKKSDGHIRISFTDDGMGMDKATRDKLFHPFFTTKEPGEGTGLGLPLSHSIILEHMGTMEIESTPDQGATFIITLPVTQQVEETPTETATISAAPLEKTKSARILVVDDEAGIRNLVSTILSAKGHTVDATGDAREALYKLDSTSYDIILMDIRMPGMSGIELYVKVLEMRPELAGKILFITGDTSDAQARDFLESNKLSYITKPFDKESLEKKVNGLL